MTDIAISPESEALTDLILTMFRANNLTLAWGDRLVGPLGLTSARWQILGAIVAAERPQSVAWLARDLRANRQNIQRIVNDLQREGIVAFEPNPHHRRSQLVVLTEVGKRTYEAALDIYFPQTSLLADGMSVADIEAAKRILTLLLAKLEREDLATVGG